MLYSYKHDSKTELCLSCSTVKEELKSTAGLLRAWEVYLYKKHGTIKLCFYMKNQICLRKRLAKGAKELTVAQLSGSSKELWTN